MAFPLDLIQDYFYRPRPRSAQEIAERKVLLRRKCEELMGFVRVLEQSRENLEEKKNFFSKWKAGRTHGKKENELKKELVMLEQEFEIFEVETQLSSNPVWALLKLLLGCFAFLLSFILLIQIVFYKLVVK